MEQPLCVSPFWRLRIYQSMIESKKKLYGSLMGLTAGSVYAGSEFKCSSYVQLLLQVQQCVDLRFCKSSVLARPTKSDGLQIH
jgi:hypothetical protein